MRQSYICEWLNKPFAVWRILEPLANRKMNESLDTLPNWYRTHKEAYLNGLETGDIELPSEPPYWERSDEEDQTIDGGF